MDFGSEFNDGRDIEIKVSGEAEKERE